MLPKFCFQLQQNYLKLATHFILVENDMWVPFVILTLLLLPIDGARGVPRATIVA